MLLWKRLCRGCDRGSLAPTSSGNGLVLGVCLAAVQ
jgi:hypothetical protein